MNGQLYTKNSDVLFTDIGDRIEGGGGEALLCYTDHTRCCSSTGRWFKLGGGDVGEQNNTGDYYVSRGLGVIRLHRKNNTFPVGVFCCEVPDSRSRSQTLCIDIGKFVNLLNLRYNFSHQSAMHVARH